MTVLTDRPLDAHDEPALTPVLELRVCEDLHMREVTRFRERVHEALDMNPELLVVDLSDCGFFDAQALAVLLAAHRTQRRRSARLVLRGISPRGMRILALTGLHRVFDLE